MFVTYGSGDNLIQLQMEKTNSFAHDAVLDGRNNRLYVKRRLDAEFILNPAATAYVRSSVGRIRKGSFVSPQTASVLPMQTVEVLQQKLLLPRQQLVIQDELKNEVARVPRLNYTTDAANGPTPIHFSVLEVQGNKSMRVRWVIEWAEDNGQEWSKDGSPAIKSYNFQSAAGIDENLWDTILYEGVVVFEASYLDKTGLSPDDFRGFFVPQARAGYKRSDVKVQLDDDGITLRYWVTDSRDRHVYYGQAFGITDVEVVQGVGEEFSDPILGVGATLADTQRYFERRAAKLDARKDRGPSGGKAEVKHNQPLSLNIANGLAMIGGIIQMGTRFLPTRTWWIVVRVWGCPEARQANLAIAARAVLHHRMRACFGIDGLWGLNAAFRTHNMTEIYNPVDNVVELKVSLNSTILNTAINWFGAAFQSPPAGLGGAAGLGAGGVPWPTAFANLGFVPQDDLQNSLLLGAPVTGQFSAPFNLGTNNPRKPEPGFQVPFNNAGARHDSVVSLVAQILKGEAASPGQSRQVRTPPTVRDPFTEFQK